MTWMAPARHVEASWPPNSVISQPLASQHLRTLRPTGSVLVERRGRTATYRLADEQVAHGFLDACRHSREGRNA